MQKNDERRGTPLLATIDRAAVVVPLDDLPWYGDAVEVGAGMSLQRLHSSELGDSVFKNAIDAIETGLRSFDTCLVVEATDRPRLKPAVLSAAFLFALWLQRPTRAQACYRFERRGDAWRTTLLLDRFQFNRARVDDEVTLADLEAVGAVFPSLEDIAVDGRRLRTALMLSLRSCESKTWQVALICAVAAIETVLTYTKKAKKGRGIAERLATCYACLIASSKTERDGAVGEFREIYGFRSDLVHGRGFDFMHDEADANLKKLARVQEVLRRVWGRVLRDATLRAELEKDDAAREVFFERVCRGYATPARER